MRSSLTVQVSTATKDKRMAAIAIAGITYRQ